MTKTRYTITTKGSRTIIRRHGGGPPAPAGRTSAPPWDEIKHIFERYPITASKPKAPAKPKKKKRK